MSEEKKPNMIDLALARLNRKSVIPQEPTSIESAREKGVTVASARIFEIRGRCEHCSGDHVPKWRRGGKLVERIWPDGRRDWACHYCGREVKESS